MANSGRLSLTEGLVTALVPEVGHIDAAVSGNTAGVELELSSVAVYVGADPSYRAPLTLSLSLRAATMRTLGTLLLAKSGAPVFNERDWQLIATILDAQADRFTVPESAAWAAKIADQIKEAYS